ncbi:MAG TPA: tRNA pseudouridine(55) synthase TruB [Acidimicrobiales bacterium]|nr:tRNA pseudouridine(55) synthase TruB [Acidimicrobiales bacterium]
MADPQRSAAPDGLAVVDKPAGWTSHDVVAKSRGLLGTRKVGHSGTLDPDATGVLLLGVGRVTRLLRFLGVHPKSYVGELVLGVETSTLDAAGDVTAVHDMGGVDLAAVRSAAGSFVGEIDQIPPMVSAVKVGGRRLHELAREGVSVEREPRRVTVHELEIDPTDDPAVFRLSVRCSSGTYVRSLAADLGRALGGGAHLRALRRTAIGPFDLARAVPLEQLSPDALLPPAAALAGYAQRAVDDELAAAARDGKVLGSAELGVDGDGPWAILDADGGLVAVYEPFRGERVKPAVVVAAR